MAYIELRSISKTYDSGAAPAVEGLDLSVSKGEIMTLLGPSGCGKTTALRLIAGFEEPDSGSVFLKERNMHGVPPEKRNVGMVFQDYALFPHLDVRQNIGFGLKKAPEKEKKIKSMIELTGLQGHEEKMPSMLSGGQQGRVALARALARNPSVVLLDEPFGALDADLRDRMRKDVVSIIRSAGATAVFVTHDQKEAMMISDRIAVMNGGKIEQVGSPREIYQHPETRFVAGFVGRSNILTGRISADGCSIESELGLIKCHHTHGCAPGEKVVFSIRPCGFERDSRGRIKGKIAKPAFTGDNTDACLKVKLPEGKDKEILVHIHPEEDVSEGDEACFRVIPYFVAVVDEKKKENS